MNPNSSEQTFLKIEKLIKSSRFNEAFLLLKNQFSRFPSLLLEKEKMDQLEKNYVYMLDYLADGHLDPSNNEVLEQIRDSLYRFNDIFIKEANLKDKSDQYSSVKRLFNLKGESFESLLNNLKKNLNASPEKTENENQSIWTEETASLNDELFNYVWTIFGSGKKDYEDLGKALISPEIPDFIKASLISAIILGNITYFDSESFDLLLNAYEVSDSLELKARTITGIVLISVLYPHRLTGNLKLRSRMIMTMGDENIKPLVNEVLFNLIRTFDTKRIDEKMRNEVIPGLMKIKPEIIDKMRDMGNEAENFLSDGNPNWEDLFEDSDIGKKLQEINELQMEGADVMVTAFSNLKSFPFFTKISNWFLPFNPDNHLFKELGIEDDSVALSRFRAVMCDSDLHSFLLSIQSMPVDKRNLMFKNLQNQIKEAKEVMENIKEESDFDRLSLLIRHHFQDIYRFFKFYRKKDEFKDPFALPVKASDASSLMSVLGINDQNIRVIAEFYFKNKYYEEAVGFFELANNDKDTNFDIWEKIGYCYDRMGRFDLAVNWYKKAELVNDDNVWLTKKLSIALKNLGKFEESIPYYEKSLELDPENYHLIMSAGQSYFEAGRTEEALKLFHKARYLNPEKQAPLRALAWSELVSGNSGKALTFYSMILESGKSDASDYLNIGHSELSRGNFKDALINYKRFVELSEKGDIKNLLLAFKDDTDIIKKLGIKTKDLRLIVDKIRYDIKG